MPAIVAKLHIRHISSPYALLLKKVIYNSNVVKKIPSTLKGFHKKF